MAAPRASRLPAGRCSLGPRVAAAAAGAAALVLGAHVGRAELRGAPAAVTEAGCDLAVTFDGPIVHVTETHRLVAGGDVQVAAVYTAPLAAGAVVDGFRVAVGGREETGIVVPVESLDNETPAALGLAPDLGTLRVGRVDDARVVEARLYPVATGRVTGFTLRWSAPAQYADGRLSLTVPPRGSGDNLGRCQVRLEARPGVGIRAWSALRVAGVWVGAGARVRGVVSGASPADALVIEAQPTWVSDAPVLAAAHAASDDGVVSTIALYVPDQPTKAAFAPGRLLFLVDTSRSVGDAGRRAALAVIEALTRAAPTGTPIEAVLFDRGARRAVGAWTTGDAAGLARLTRAVREAPLASGTDLGEALALASGLVGSDAARVVIITDGVLPTDQTGRELLGHFTAPAGRVVVDVIVPLAEGAAAPARGGLTSLADVYGGRVIAFPASHPLPGGALTDSLATGRPLDALTLVADGDALDEVELPGTLAAGSGVVLTTTLPRRPRRLELRAERGGAVVTARAGRLPAGAERFALAAFAVAGGETAGLARARHHQLVGDETAMVVLDRAAAGGAARHDLARRTGVLTYTPPPEELDAPTPAPTVPVIVDRRAPPHGELPTTSVKQALRDQLLPRLRVCYRGQVAVAPTLGGRLEVELEIARGEVMAVRLLGDHFPEGMIACAADAAFAITTPTYALGGVPDTVFVIRKPFVFRPPTTPTEQPTVSLDDVLYPTTNPAGRPALEVEPDAPL